MKHSPKTPDVRPIAFCAEASISAAVYFTRDEESWLELTLRGGDGLRCVDITYKMNSHGEVQKLTIDTEHTEQLPRLLRELQGKASALEPIEAVA
jgi:hypothetical protein